jgi:hypothetical protein
VSTHPEQPIATRALSHVVIARTDLLRGFGIVYAGEYDRLSVAMRKAKAFRGRTQLMAKRTHTVLVDDIDGSDADETVYFGIDGVNYEIELSAKHAGQLRDALATYTANGRKVAGRRRRGTGSGGAASAADVRAWARENGRDVPDRGRVSAEVRQAYAEAH